jgi:8-oxo-dGTP diphosphatase
MADDHDAELISAAGAVVWRPGAAGPEIALVHRPSYDDWSYPKGKLHREEHPLSCAIREVTEETGLRVVLGRPLAPSAYRVGGRPKHVSYWAARCAESLGFVPNSEVDEVIWLPAAVARQRLTYERDVALLDEFRSGPAGTVPLILLRHASAGKKAAKARTSDLARPLDGRGSADAKLLGALLASYGQCRVVSSPAERCMATVRPYAAVAGVAVEAEPAFATPAEPLAEQAGLRAAALAASGVPTVICAHRENLAAVTAAACRALGASSPKGRRLRKGAFLVLQSAGGVLVSAERHEVTG